MNLKEKRKRRESLIIKRAILEFKKKGGIIYKQEDEKVAPDLFIRDHLSIIPNRDDFEIETIFGFDPVHPY